MDSSPILLGAIALSWGSALFGGFKYVIGSSIYDIKYESAVKTVRKQPNLQILRSRPGISIVLLDKSNDLSQLKACIKAVRKSGYRKYELVILDKLPENPKELRPFIRTLKGPLVLFIDTDCVLAENSLKNAINYLKINNAEAVCVQFQLHPSQELGSLSKKLKQSLLITPACKLHALRGDATTKNGVLVSKSYLLKKCYQNTTDTITSLIKIILSLSWFALFGYFVFLALAHEYPLPLALLVLSILFYSLIMLLSQPATHIKTKMASLLTLPGGLALLFISLAGDVLKKASRYTFEALFPAKLFKRS